MIDSYYSRNAEKLRARSRDHYAANREKKLEYQRQYREARKLRDPGWAEQEQARVRKYNREYKYGIKGATGENRFGACEICGVDTGRPLHLDHDHKTGEIRGWLCRSCNHGLGKFKDSSELLRKAAEYLDRL